MELVEQSLAKVVGKLRFPCATDGELALGHLLGVGSDKGCESVGEEVALVVAIASLGEYEDKVMDDLAVLNELNPIIGFVSA